MNWVFDNPLAKMSDIAFVVSLIWAMTAIVIVAFWLRRRSDASRALEPMRLPRQVDPVQIAYLRGGNTEVIRAILMDLVERGWIKEASIELNAKPLSKPAKNGWVVAENAESPRPSGPVQEALLEHFKQPQTAVSIFNSAMAELAKSETTAWRDWAKREQLLSDPKTFRLVKIFNAVALGVLCPVVLWKWIIEFNERSLGFPLFGAIPIVAIGGILCVVAGSYRRLSYRGQMFLRDLQAAYRPNRWLRNVETATTREPGEISLAMMSMGLFGVSSLEKSSLGSFRDKYAKSSVNTGGCSVMIAGSCGFTPIHASGTTSGDCDAASGDAGGSGSGCGGSCGGGCGGGAGGGCGSGGGCGGGGGGCGS